MKDAAYGKDVIYDVVLHGERGDCIIIPPLQDKHYQVLASDDILSEENGFLYKRGETADTVTLRDGEALEPTARYKQLREFFRAAIKALNEQEGVLATYAVDYTYESVNKLSE